MVSKVARQNVVNGKQIKAEKPIETFVPYTRHIDDYTIKTKGGHYVQMLKIPGFSFETADQLDLNSKKRNRSTLLRGLANSRFAIYHHVIRREVMEYPQGDFDNTWCDDLDKAYKIRLSTRRMFKNEQYVSIVRRPAQNVIGALNSFMRSILTKVDQRQLEELEKDNLKAIHEAAQMLEAGYKSYGAQRLKVFDDDGIMLSEPLEMLGYLINLDVQPVKLSTSSISNYLPRKRVLFNKESFEIRGASTKDVKVGAMLSIKDYAAMTYPGMLDDLLRLPNEFVLTQSFGFVDRQKSLSEMRDVRRKIQMADEGIESQITDIEDGIDDVGSGRSAMGEHHLTVSVTAPNANKLNKAISETTRIFGDYGITVVREDLNMQAAFWAQLPDNFGYIARKAKITTENFASFASLHNFPSGQMFGNHWGEPITILETTSGTPYAFSFHERDVGNFTVIGPTGSGKTVLLNFLIAQAQRVRPKTIFFDKDRGAEIFLRAINGNYTVVRPGEKTGFNPLQLEDTELNRAFLREWLAKLSIIGTEHRLREDERAIISDAIASNFQLPKEKRTLTNLMPLFSGFEKKSTTSLAARLSRWYGKGDKAWLFDNPVDTLSLDDTTIGFDTTTILDDEAARTPWLMYVFHRIDEILNGERVIIMLDEGWKLLDDKEFATRIKDWEKTIRKQNGLLGFATQSVGDIFDSSVGTSIVDQSPTNIFMPNPRATKEAYCDGFGLTLRELYLLKNMPPESRMFLLRHGQDTVIAKLNLNGMPEHLAVLSGRTETVLVCEELREKYGNNPDDWLPHFIKAVVK